MTTLSQQQVVNPLLSGMDQTVLAQLQTYIETAINVAGTVYPNLDTQKTTPLDVKNEFVTVTGIIDGMIPALNALPTDSESFTADQILELAQQGAAMSAGIIRTTGSLKSLQGPVSHEDGIALLNNYKEFQVKLALLFAASNVRLGGFEQGAPGICEYCFNKLMNMIVPLTQSLSEVLPPSISPNEAQAIHNDIQSVCDDSLTRAAAFK